MNNSNWLHDLATVAQVATPFILAGLGIFGWRLRRRFDRRLELEDKLREDRITTYNDILEPFVILFMSEEAWKTARETWKAGSKKGQSVDRDKAVGQVMHSVDYRRQAFKMSLVGSDDVVRAYNALMQHMFHLEGVESDESSTFQTMALLGTFLLSIRRSLGNEETTMSNVEMLEWFLTDARRIPDQLRQ